MQLSHLFCRMTVVQSYVCGVHHMKCPRYKDLNPNVADILIHAIAINSAYTSRVLVRLQLMIFMNRLNNLQSIKLFNLFRIARGPRGVGNAGR